MYTAEHLPSLHHPEAPSVSFLQYFRRTRLKVVAALALLNSASTADEAPPPPDAPIVAEWEQTPVSLKELEDRIRININLLTHEDWPIREQATDFLKGEIIRALQLRNPLSPDIMNAISDPTMMLEGQRRLERIVMPSVENETQCAPGRILSPNTANKTLHQLLEEQFRLEIKGVDSDIDQQLANIREGFDGELSSAALVRLCTTTGSVPIISDGKILLRKAEQGEVVWNDGKTCFLQIRSGNTFAMEVFHAPDQSVLLSTESAFPDNALYATISSAFFMKWDSTRGQSPTPKLAILAVPESIKVHVGVLPITQEVPIGSQNYTEFGLQRIRSGEVKQVESGVWETELVGNITDTESTSNEHATQLISANRIEPLNAGGNPIAKQSLFLLMNGDEFSIKITTSERPHRARVRTFKKIKTETLNILPK